jgi:S1-C subfamily serine protease
MGGVVIANMYRESPAVEASLRIGDIITAINGQAVTNSQQALSLIAARTPGSQVTLHLIRGRAGMEATLRVTERPNNLRAGH